MNAPIPILYLINGLNAGGAERQLITLLERLDRARFAPQVCTIYADSAVPPHAPFLERLHALNIPLHSLNQPKIGVGRTASLRRLIALEWRLRPRIVHSTLHYANLLARVARPFCPRHTLITSAREVYTPRQLRSESLTGWLDDHLIVNAPHLNAKAARASCLVSVIPNGLPIDHFAHNPDPDRRRLGGAARLVLALVGRDAPVKDVPTLFRALALLPDPVRAGTRLLLVGGIHADANGVLNVGAVDDVRPYLHAADALVLPSRSEGLPNVILEAHAAGTPAIVSHGANGSGVVTHGVNGWTFETGDAHALADIITHVYALTDDQRAIFAANAREKAARYRVENMVAHVESLYDDILGKGKT